jgi:hypothetical protein
MKNAREPPETGSNRALAPKGRKNRKVRKNALSVTKIMDGLFPHRTGARMVFWTKIKILQKIFTHGRTTTYRKKSLVVRVPFSHWARTFAPYIERLCISLCWELNFFCFLISEIRG